MGDPGWQEGDPLSHDGTFLIRLTITLSVLQIFFVVARFYTRYMQHMHCGADDYVILVALVRILLAIRQTGLHPNTRTF